MKKRRRNPEPSLVEDLLACRKYEDAVEYIHRETGRPLITIIEGIVQTRGGVAVRSGGGLIYLERILRVIKGHRTEQIMQQGRAARSYAAEHGRYPSGYRR